MTSSVADLRRGERETSRRVASSDWTRRVAGAGLAARAVLYAVLAVLALQVAFGHDRERTDSNGALHAVARQPFGRTLLVVLAAGFVAYAAWRFVAAATPTPGREHDGAKRALDAARGLLYIALCIAALGVLIGAHQQNKDRQTQEWTARVLGWPGGRVLVVAIGIAVIAAGLANIAHVVTGSWRNNFDLNGRSESTRSAITVVAVAGLFARAVVFAAIGAFIVQAALTFDPGKAVGLDGALHRLARASFGTAALAAVAVGLLAYALYTALEAALRSSTVS